MRTDSDAVIALLADYDDSIEMGQCIEWGNIMTTDNCINATTTPAYSDAKLELIERNLSAHYYEIIKARQKFRAAGKVQESLESRVDLGLNLTRYGQSAMLIDNAGNLAALNNSLEKVRKPLPAAGKRVGIFWAGKDDCP